MLEERVVSVFGGPGVWACTYQGGTIVLLSDQSPRQGPSSHLPKYLLGAWVLGSQSRSQSQMEGSRNPHPGLVLALLLLLLLPCAALAVAQSLLPRTLRFPTFPSDTPGRRTHG